MQRIYDMIAIGAGASGMLASIRAAERKKNVLLLEKADRPGKKILASGNGRCNLMNCRAPVYFGDREFAEDVLRLFSFQKIRDYLNHLGLKISEENDGRFYPVTYQSSTVLSVLKSAIEISGANMKTKCKVSSVLREKECFTVTTENGENFSARSVLVSSGGAAQPRLGGSTDGYKILKSMGHTIIPETPVLVPLVTDQRSISGLSGIRVKCRIELCDLNGPLHCEEGELLFTDYGISGICVMQCARYAKDRKTYMKVNFLHRIFTDYAQAMDEMKERRSYFRDLSPQYLMEGILAEKIAYAVMKQAGIPMRGETAGELNDSDLANIVSTAFAYRINIIGDRGFDYAQVTSGGASCREFSPRTMESMIIPGLYASGEVLNIDGDCGGYNLMFAFASGLIAGNAVCRE